MWHKRGFECGAWSQVAWVRVLLCCLQLCNLGPVTSPPWSLVSPSVAWDTHRVCLSGLNKEMPTERLA